MLGTLIALIVGRAMMLPSPLTNGRVVLWVAIAVSAGLALAVLAVTVPVWTAARRSTVAGARAVIGRGYRPLWQRVALDLVLLAAAAVAFWQTASGGYQVVVTPEGVAQTAVSYQTFLAPLCLWLGIGLLAMRLSAVGLAHGRRILTGIFRPIAAELAGVVAAALGRERVRIARGIVLVALAFSFAVATAIFNTTYDTQARVDAQLTNGADVTVTSATTAPSRGQLSALAALPGVAAIQPMQHRYAYVGNDLQDLYGIDPRTISQATGMANAYFANGDARATLAALADQADGVLVSAETVKDYQLHPGDRINLRLQQGSDHQYHVIPFQFIGVVREFPTAPKDSFLVGNAAYIAAQTGMPAAEIVLMRTNADPAALANRVRAVVQSLPGAQVTDLGTAQYRIGSSLTAVNLRGLTQLELAFAVLFIAGATGLVMALGMVERRRTYAVLVALGATTRQVGAFVWSEGLLILIGGAIVGVATGVAVAAMLVKVLTGVFDPPP